MPSIASRRARRSLLAALLLAVAACGPDGGEAAPARGTTTTAGAPGEPESAAGDVEPVDVAARDAAAAAAAGQVTASGRSFVPPVVKIAAGEAVAWRFEDGFSTPHEVAGDGFSSGARSQGTFVHQFEQTGTFAYRCTIHPEMSGTVEVG